MFSVDKKVCKSDKKLKSTFQMKTSTPTVLHIYSGTRHTMLQFDWSRVTSEQTSKLASEQASKQASKQACKRAIFSYAGWVYGHKTDGLDLRQHGLCPQSYVGVFI